MGILFVPMFVVGLVMLAKNPDLLRKRLNAKEQEAEQKTVAILNPPTVLDNGTAYSDEPLAF